MGGIRNVCIWQWRLGHPFIAPNYALSPVPNSGSRWFITHQHGADDARHRLVWRRLLAGGAAPLALMRRKRSRTGFGRGSRGPGTSIDLPSAIGPVLGEGAEKGSCPTAFVGSFPGEVAIHVVVVVAAGRCAGTVPAVTPLVGRRLESQDGE
jgi:hypothetical protein